ncbi:MAG: FAD-binding oxidoreductase [Acidobacteriaceae bacterium]
MGGVVRAEELRVELGGAVVVREDEGRTIASPSTTDEVAALLRLCSAKGLRVEVAGAGTKREWGGGAESDVVLETRALRGVREHSWQDLTATVGAGTPWAEMQRVLAAHGQMVALDPLWEQRATVGGVLATNDSGAWRLRYGSARDLVIGMTIVLADGTIAKTGGKVVKNVAGYDLHKLMIGAFGTLGVITEVTFRLHPLPRDLRSFTIRAPDSGGLATLIDSVRRSHLLTEGLQLRGTQAGLSLDIQLIAPVDRDHLTLFDNLAAAAQCAVEPAAETARAARESLFVQPDRLILKATMLPQDVIPFAEEAVEKGGDCVAQTVGVLLASFPGDMLSLKLAEEFRYHVGSQGGSTVLLKRTAASSVVEWSAHVSEGDRSRAFPLMREIKRRFDPERVLNRGAMGGV